MGTEDLRDRRAMEALAMAAGEDCGSPPTDTNLAIAVLYGTAQETRATATETECVLNEYFLRAGASRSEPENNHQTCFVLISYHGLAVQQSLVTI